MRKTTRLLAAVPVIASLVCAPAVAARAAPVARAAPAAPPSPGWRIVAAFPKQSSIDALAASGTGSAWAVEYCAKPCASGDGLILRHWNGRSWQALPQPAVSRHTGNADPLLATAPGSRDVWAAYNLYDQDFRASAVEWTGKSWARATVFPAGTSIQGLAAPGPSDIWAFGLTGELSDHQYVIRDNGKSWSTAPSPGPAMGPWTAAARSAHDIWAEAIASTGFGLAFSHWNGTRWVRQAVPPAPKGLVGLTGGLTGDIVLSGQDNVWGYGYFAFKAGSAVDWLVHWNGKAWSTVRVPYPLNQSIEAGPLGSDGHGGTWLAATPADTNREYLYHVSAAGHWFRLPVPTLPGGQGTEVAGFAAIPGTSSVYAYGAGPDAGGERGVILEYGN